MSAATFPVQAYWTQRELWPTSGRHVLAQHDDDTIVVYQAFRPAIVTEAVSLQRFGPSFSRSRMSWIKPNFLWMMFRCGWATKVDQERVVAVRIRRQFFERLLTRAVWSSFMPEIYSTHENWREALDRSDVRMQWDPDHEPDGRPVERRAVQLGLRGATLAEYAGDAVVSIFDATPFVEEQRIHAIPPYNRLLTPVETVFSPRDVAARANSKLDAWGQPGELAG